MAFFSPSGMIAEATAQKERLFLWVPVFLGLGIAVYFNLRIEPPLWTGAALCAVFWPLTALALRIKAAGPLLLLTGALGLAATGFTAAQIQTRTAYTPLLEKKTGPVWVTGTIEQVEALAPGAGSRVLLNHLEIEDIAPENTPSKVRLRLRQDGNIAAGMRIRALSQLNPPGAPVSPGAFDFQRHAYFQGIGAVGFIYKAPEILEPAPRAGRILERFRQKVIERVEARVPYPQSAVVATLLTGQRTAIRDEDRDAMRDAGLAHLLAISGMHVGMIAAVLFFFSRLAMAAVPYMALHWPIKKIAAGIALGGIALYTLAVGATIPTQRALMMTGLVLLAVMLDRSPFSLRLVALAACVILLLSPASLTGVSFQMSFGAVTALICFYEYIRPGWSAWHAHAGIARRTALYFTGIVLSTLIAEPATGFFALYHFQNITLYGTLANFVATPLMAFVTMPAAVLTYLLLPFGLEGPMLGIMGWGTSWILAASHWTAGLDGAVLLYGAWPSPVFAGTAAAFVMFLLWQGWRGKTLAALAFLLFCLPLSLNRQPDILISEDAKLIAIRGDTGKLYLSSLRAGRFTAENWLRRNGQPENERFPFPRQGSAENFPLTCGEQGCRGEMAGHKIALSFTARAWQEDCRWADLVIAQVPVDKKHCAGPSIIIDRFSVWREGAHTIRLFPSKIRIETVEAKRGQRPWTK